MSSTVNWITSSKLSRRFSVSSLVSSVSTQRLLKAILVKSSRFVQELMQMNGFDIPQVRLTEVTALKRFKCSRTVATPVSSTSHLAVMLSSTIQGLAVEEQADRFLDSPSLAVVNWSFDSGDSAGKSPSSTIMSYKKIAQSYPKPQIALNHEVSSNALSCSISSLIFSALVCRPTREPLKKLLLPSFLCSSTRDTSSSLSLSAWE